MRVSQEKVVRSLRFLERLKWDIPDDDFREIDLSEIRILEALLRKVFHSRDARVVLTSQRDLPIDNLPGGTPEDLTGLQPEEVIEVLKVKQEELLQRAENLRNLAEDLENRAMEAKAAIITTEIEIDKRRVDETR